MATASLSRKPNKLKLDYPAWGRDTAAHIMHQLKCDPIAGMCHIALNMLECGTCRGKLRTRYALPAGEHTASCTRTPCTCEGVGERICQSCFGSGMENISPDLRARMFAELAKYKHPQFKQIEDRSSESQGERQTIEIVLVRPSKRLPASPAPIGQDASVQVDTEHGEYTDTARALPAGGNQDDIIEAEPVDEP